MRRLCLALAALAPVTGLPAEDLGAMWGTAAAEAKYYPLVDIPIPSTVPMRPGGLEVLPDGRLAVDAVDHREHAVGVLATKGRQPGVEVGEILAVEEPDHLPGYDHILRAVGGLSRGYGDSGDENKEGEKRACHRSV